MTADDFRKIALSFPETSESAHMHHPDFRVGRKIFATLSYPAKDWAVVKLTPKQQKRFVRDEPNVFQPVKGNWGVRGYTDVHLPTASTGVVREAVAAAWRNVAPKRPVKDQQ